MFMALVSFVEAIEEGKIVRVPEDYAQREGLLIIKRLSDGLSPDVPLTRSSPRLLQATPAQFSSERLARKGLLKFDAYRRPLRKEDHASSLIENFHWKLQRGRKLKGLTRKQVAGATGIAEEVVKELELGIVGNDFVALAGLERFYGINLRQGGSYLPHTPSASSPTDVSTLADATARSLFGSDLVLEKE
jgi:ribosome-binding protein aMBF1 (putative translation factor)